MFWVAGAVSVSFQVAVTAIQIRLTTVALMHTSINGLALAASVLDVCALIGIVAFLCVRLRASPVKLRALLLVGAAVVVALSAILTAYSMAWAIENVDRIPSTASREAHGLSLAGVVLWAVSVLAQLIFYAFQLRPQYARMEGLGSDTAIERSSPAQPAKRPFSLHLTVLAPPSPSFMRSASEPHSPQSGHSASPRSSMRHSVHQVLRPVTSRSRLLFRQSVNTRDSRSTYSGWRASAEHDGFESWDTSNVEETNQTTCTPDLRPNRLETIHSRPVSPAKPLDGPFIGPATETPLPDSPLQSPLASPSSDTSSIRGFPLPTPSRRPSSQQSHIHPLFRSESPNPPPLASPGTVITASPLAGQVVSAEHVRSPRTLHSAQGNRPPTATPRSRSESIRSARVRSPSPTEPPASSPLHETIVHDFG